MCTLANVLTSVRWLQPGVRLLLPHLRGLLLISVRWLQPGVRLLLPHLRGLLRRLRPSFWMGASRAGRMD